jgi:hypothetical protein
MDERIVILAGNEIPAAEETGTGFGAEKHSQERAIDKLQRAWPEVMRRLCAIVELDTDAQSGRFDVETVEFGISVEAGFDFVMKGTATADAKITFRRKSG